uniref:Uncharacterized protein n=1 Tax=Anguilla anguilla TaxID=7936 RepID=A0A0E9PKJ8_ANGAN
MARVHGCNGLLDFYGKMQINHHRLPIFARCLFIFDNY